jgi:hypothetical protein
VTEPKAQSATASPGDEAYPACETTLWHIGQWRCDYWRPEGKWRGGSLRLFRNDRLVRTAVFGLAAQEQSDAWRLSIQEKPDHDPR